MTETYTPAADIADIDDALDRPSATLDREADRILAEAETRSFRPVNSVRGALREDAGLTRAWAADRAERTREVITEEPLRATLYALGAGVVLGLLLRR